MVLRLLPADPLEPPDQPLTTAEAKLFLRVDGADEDTLIDEMVAAAADFIADMSWTSVTFRTWELVLPFFPGGGRPIPAELAPFYPGVSGRRRHASQIRLPRGPVTKVVELRWKDTENAQQTTEVGFQVSLTDDDALVAPVAGSSWPETSAEALEPVVIKFQAGYTAPDGDNPFPPQVKQAVRMLTAHWYENREAYMAGVVGKEMELGLANLCRHFDWFRFNPGG